MLSLICRKEAEGMDAEHHIQRSIDWMEENLCAQITLEDATELEQKLRRMGYDTLIVSR